MANEREQTGPRVVSIRKNRQTGTEIAVVDNRDGLFECEGYGDDPSAPPEGCTWASVCNDHGFYILHASRRLAEAWAAQPADWCEECDQQLNNEREEDQ